MRLWALPRGRYPRGKNITPRSRGRPAMHTRPAGRQPPSGLHVSAQPVPIAATSTASIVWSRFSAWSEDDAARRVAHVVRHLQPVLETARSLALFWTSSGGQSSPGADVAFLVHRERRCRCHRLGGLRMVGESPAERISSFQTSSDRPRSQRHLRWGARSSAQRPGPSSRSAPEGAVPERAASGPDDGRRAERPLPSRCLTAPAHDLQGPGSCREDVH
jgi:hypothetical protein